MRIVFLVISDLPYGWEKEYTDDGTVYFVE
jgi:hypothetical protein